MSTAYILLGWVVGASAFRAEVSPIPEAWIQAMRGTTWHEGCPVGVDELRQLTLTHHGFDGRTHRGMLIVHLSAAEAVVGAFREIFALGYPIERMVPASEYDGDDERSMAANNTSAFNCRPSTGRSRRVSVHAYGRAVDVNPLYNPWVKGDRVAPAAGRTWRDRTLEHPAMLRADHPAVRAFTRRGFRWGGAFRSVHDPQHFELRVGPAIRRLIGDPGAPDRPRRP